MYDLIDRNQLLQWLKVSDFENYNGDECFRYTIREIENAPAVDRLIPCSEQLPDKDGKYLVLQNEQFDILEYNTELKQFGYRYEDEDEPRYPYVEWAEMMNVTHWMQLPEKP